MQFFTVDIANEVVPHTKRHDIFRMPPLRGLHRVVEVGIKVEDQFSDRLRLFPSEIQARARIIGRRHPGISGNSRAEGAADQLGGFKGLEWLGELKS